jgi:hypothetical protein
MSNQHAIATTPTGYHMLSRRQVALTIESGVLRLHENGQVVTLTRAQALPIEWVGTAGNQPLVPLAGLVLGAPGGEYVVVTTDTTIVLGDWVQRASPAPYVFVSGEDLMLMATACGIGITRREAWVPPPPMSAQKSLMMVFAIVGVVGLFATLALVFGPQKRRSNETCELQRLPQEELYPRVSCQDARAELDKVARGETTPSAFVLRAKSIIVDARDVTGPGTITCDGIEFAAVDAKQAAAEPIVLGDGPHSVLVEALADGTLRPSQYCICCNIVGRERRGEMPSE